jgi:hypothetical protein
MSKGEEFLAGRGEGSLCCVEASQQSRSEVFGGEEKGKELCSRELGYVCDLPLRLRGS